MKRRITALILCLLIVLSALPSAVFAEEGIISGLAIDSEGIITWDAYPGATTYYLFGDTAYPGKRLTAEEALHFNIYAYFASNSVASGTYTVTISAENNKYKDIAQGTITVDYIGLEKYATPTGLDWNGFVASWNPVASGVQYIVKCYDYSDTRFPVAYKYTKECSIDLSSCATYLSNQYLFTVTVASDDTHAQSDESAQSSLIWGKYTMGEFAISLDGDNIVWTNYVDEFEKEAFSYYLYSDATNPSVIPSLVISATEEKVNIKSILDMYGAASGKYAFSMSAMNEFGQVVSLFSNYVEYEYVSSGSNDTYPLNIPVLPESTAAVFIDNISYENINLLPANKIITVVFAKYKDIDPDKKLSSVDVIENGLVKEKSYPTIVGEKDNIRYYSITVSVPENEFALYFNMSKDVTNNFKDVKDGDYFYDPVLWAISHEPVITKGVDETHFSPDSPCTRGQIVTFLWRLFGERKIVGVKNDFVDVPADAYYYDAVMWALDSGITNGLDETHFGPDSPCTRGQVVTFLYRALRIFKELESKDNIFEDVKEGDYFYEAVLWALENEVTKGVDSTHFGPNSTCTRAHIVTFMYRAVEALNID